MEIQSPNKKVILVESEETQGYVRKSLNLSRDEAEEVSFVPSANSIPQGPMFWCDNLCSDKALSFWQFASVVIDDVKESYTANLCQQCCNERFGGKRTCTLEELAVENSRGEEGASWKTMENAGERPVNPRNVGVSFFSKSASEKVYE